MGSMPLKTLATRNEARYIFDRRILSMQSIWRRATRVIPDFHVSFANIGSRVAHTGASAATGIAYLLFALMLLSMIGELLLAIMP